MYVLYDRDWSLTNTKDWLSKVYRKPYRVDLRTETYVVESDVLLSKAFSAYQRGDFGSACVFAGMAVESMVKMFMEITFAPISNSHFIEALEESANKLGMPHISTGFLTVTRLSGANRDDAEGGLKLFEGFWNNFSSYIREHSSEVDSLHFRIKTKLGYCGNPDFLRGVIGRTREMIDRERYVEASHYLLSTLCSMVETFVPFISVVKRTKFSEATFLSWLRGLEESAQMCENVVEAFDLRDVDRGEAGDVLRLARQLICGVRRRRRTLIGWFVG